MAQKSAAGGRILIQFVSQLCYRNTKKKKTFVRRRSKLFIFALQICCRNTKKNICVLQEKTIHFPLQLCYRNAEKTFVCYRSNYSFFPHSFFTETHKKTFVCCRIKLFIFPSPPPTRNVILYIYIYRMGWLGHQLEPWNETKNLLSFLLTPYWFFMTNFTVNLLEITCCGMLFAFY